MDKATYIRKIEELIAEQQEVQQFMPPSSVWWKRASAEIKRLSRLIVRLDKTGTDEELVN